MQNLEVKFSVENLSEVSRLLQVAELYQRFFEPIHAVKGASEDFSLVECQVDGSSATGTGDVLIHLKPSERFLKLMCALGAPEGDGCLS
jgi:hypothetical protein